MVYSFFAFIKLSFLKTILTSQHALVIRLLRIPHKALSRPSIKSACVLKRSTSITQLKSCVQNIFSDTKTDHVGLGYRSHRVCHKQFAAFVLRNNASLSNQITQGYSTDHVEIPVSNLPLLFSETMLRRQIRNEAISSGFFEAQDKVLTNKTTEYLRMKGVLDSIEWRMLRRTDYLRQRNILGESHAYSNGTLSVFHIGQENGWADSLLSLAFAT